MTRPSSPTALALLLAQVARAIRDRHGDLAAQVVPYALYLRRADPSVDTTALLDGFADKEAISQADDALASADLAAILRHYTAQGRDPAVYFYEEFLRAYDRDNAKGRGVHYSPPEVVSCMVRGVESILTESFGLTLNDAFIVDPCCGAGTFLRHIEQRTESRPRMIGMDLMPAPCAIASRLLSTAEVRQQDWLSCTELDHRVQVPVILGNPPYSGHSANPGKIAGLMAAYRVGLNERNPKWLQDDYVKFIRMAQHQIELAGRGIVTFITNHSYLTNPTFRVMRESLARTFDRIYVLDLNGNVKRSGGADENIFPIQMGVAISFFVKVSDSQFCSVKYAQLQGGKQSKLHQLASLDLLNVHWRNADSAAPFHLFTSQGSELSDEYAAFPSVCDIFRESSIGFVTSRDAFAVAFTRDELLDRIAALRNGALSDEELRQRLTIGDLDTSRAREALLSDPSWQDKAVEVLYRPFDRRWAYYSAAIMERPRLPFMENLMQDNIALAIGRAGIATGSDEWDLIFCADRPTDLNLFRRGGAKLFPRWVFRGSERLSNVAIDIVDQDALFAYIYAMLHSRIYRKRYAQYLQVDYPRVPIAQGAVFEATANLGQTLLDLHLMRASFVRDPGCRVSCVSGFERSGNPETLLRVGGYELPSKCLKDRAAVDSPDQRALIERAIAQTLAIQGQIDAAIEQTPPWR